MPQKRETHHAARMTAREVIDVQAETIRNLSERHTSGPPQVAVELTRNAAGKTQISVKVTANTEADARALEAHVKQVYAVSVGLYEAANRAYPLADGAGTADGAPKKALTMRQAAGIVNARARRREEKAS